LTPVSAGRRVRNVKRGDRVIGIDTKLIEKLGRNDPCPFGSGRLPAVLPDNKPLRRRSCELLHPRRSPV